METQIYPSDNLRAIHDKLTTSPWLISCLCAAWCDTCQGYRKGFDNLQTTHPDKCFAWIDIEDHAELIDDLDIESFPTILIQYQHRVLFLGTMLPDVNLVHRLILSFEESIQVNGSEKITTTIQNSSHPLPSDWSLRRILETA
nr:thioredoxin family protein [uncultured Undibacterium sp.]